MGTIPQFKVGAADFHKSADWFRGVILNIPAAVYATDAEGVITLYNEAAVAMWGRRPEIGKDLWCGSFKIFRPEDGSEMPLNECPMAVTLRTGIAVRNHEIIVERPDRTRAWVQPHPEPLFDDEGKMVGALNLLVDISHRKEMEQVLGDLNETLERRVQDRTLQLQSLCYSMAHDLRQHIRSVNMNAQMLLRELDDTLQDDHKEDLHRLSHAAKQMSQLVDDMLDLARINTQQVRQEPVDLSVLAHEVAARLIQDEQQDRTVEFKIQSQLKALGDRNLIGIVLQNLMENSFKFAPPSRTTLVEVGREKRGGEEVFFVRDNGNGFDMQFAEKVFEPFERLQNNSAVLGTGIGLATTRTIIERHGGKIWAEGTEGEGAAFYFTVNLR
jgi:PAS domain S-box-containing protein